MSPTVRLVALLLLALWGPATMHCQLEMAGLLPETLACEDSDSGHCADSVCFQVEDSHYKNTSATLKIPAPAVSENGGEVFPVLVLPAEVSVAVISPEKNGPPRDWIVRWTFERRAAPPARAPSLNA